MFLTKCLLYIFLIQTSVLVLHSKDTDNTSSSGQQNKTALEENDEFSHKRENVSTWSVIFEQPSSFNMTMSQRRIIELTITFIDPEWGQEFEFRILPQDKELLRLTKNTITPKDIKENQTSWMGNFMIEALFLGRSKVYVELYRPHMVVERSPEELDVIILRNVGKIDMLFNICICIFVALLNTNFGAVLELNALKDIVIKPVGPAIGFIGQFVVMPVLSFLIGYIFFSDHIELRLGLFFTGCTPGGGASNIFTVILGGNINLSITMTTISNLFAFGMMPLWIFTLGAVIFKDGNLMVPYKAIALMSCSLIVPLCAGIVLQKFAPIVTKKMSNILKPLSLCFVVFITVFAFTVNSYIFKLFSWRIILATSALPWIGYIIGYLLALMCRQSQSDALTIAIETGIQNTAIAIFMLNFALPQPQADMTGAVPVANSMMTPLPLLLIFVLKKIFAYSSIKEIKEPDIQESKFTEPKAELENKNVANKTENKVA